MEKTEPKCLHRTSLQTTVQMQSLPTHAQQLATKVTAEHRKLTHAEVMVFQARTCIASPTRVTPPMTYSTDNLVIAKNHWIQDDNAR
jgi:hypothetical protein